MRKILIAEDDKISLEYLKEILSETQVQVLEAKNGQEAVELCKKYPDIDLVFMDIKMPIQDGRIAAKEIKAIRPNLPIIAQTAYALNDEKEEILKDGFDAYLSKPISRTAILSLVYKFSNQKI